MLCRPKPIEFRICCQWRNKFVIYVMLISRKTIVFLISGIVNIILSWKGLVPLSRLSYAAYLVHPVIMMVHVYSKRNLIYLRDYDIVSNLLYFL